jgi:hypothetical protein
METLVKLEIDAQIIFAKNEALFVGRVVEVSEKAIKVDWFWQPIWSNFSALDVYTYSVWIPKSQVVESEKAGPTCKKWFIQNMQSHRIKPYFIDDKGTKQYL